MEYTELKEELKNSKRKAGKPMLWIAMISMTMMFAGLTSAYVISKSREDWVSFDLPMAFYISTLMILLSSITLFLAKRALKSDNRKQATLFLIATLLLGIGFVYEQFQGFGALMDLGLFFTGTNSAVSSSFLYVITVAHMLHIFAGIIVLLVIIYNHFNLRYNATDVLGLELGSIFWHFVDVLWIYLFLFFYFLS